MVPFSLHASAFMDVLQLRRFSLRPTPAHLHKRAGCCSIGPFHSGRCSRFSRCPPAGNPLCTRRPGRSRLRLQSRPQHRRSPGGVAGWGGTTDLSRDKTGITKESQRKSSLLHNTFALVLLHLELDENTLHNWKQNMSDFFIF